MTRFIQALIIWLCISVAGFSIYFVNTAGNAHPKRSIIEITQRHQSAADAGKKHYSRIKRTQTERELLESISFLRTCLLLLIFIPLISWLLIKLWSRRLRRYTTW